MGMEEDPQRRIRIKDDKIHFDYRLRPGASTARNALYPMKMAGIELDDDAI